MTVVTRYNTPAFLQGFAIGFRQRGGVADIVSPRFRVGKEEFKYRIWGKNIFNRVDTRWAYGSVPNSVETTFTSATGTVDWHVLREPMHDAETVNSDPDLDPRAMHTRSVTTRLETAREARIAAQFTNSANYPGANVITKAGGAEWNVVGGEQVITDLLTLLGTVADAGMMSRSMLTVVIPEPVWRLAMERNSAFLDAIKYTQVGVMSTDLLRAFLGVRQVVIAETLIGAAGALESRGQDILTGYPLSNPWGDNVWAGFVNDDNNPLAPTFARSFNWQAATGNQERQVRTYRAADEGKRVEFIEVAETLGEYITFSSAGGLLRNTLSTI